MSGWYPTGRRKGWFFGKRICRYEWPRPVAQIDSLVSIHGPNYDFHWREWP